jgi:hypothetical protein
VLAFVGSFALPCVPFTARLFSFTALPLQDLAVILGLAVVYLVVLDLVKVRYYRWAEKESARESAQKK